MARDSKNVRIKQDVDMEKILSQIPIEMRGKALKSAVTEAGKLVIKRAKQYVPRGDKRHKPELKPLWKTLGQNIKAYNNDALWMAIVGPKRPGGAHGHLIEGGHDVVVNRGPRKGKSPLTGSARVEGKEFMAPAVDQTLKAQDKIVMATLRKAITDAGG